MDMKKFNSENAKVNSRTKAKNSIAYKIDETNNIISHEKYKQDYVKWENENKGGKK